MCGGGPSAHGMRDVQTRLANIAEIKKAQLARQGQINIIGGGETEEYRRSLATGAKDLGLSSEDMANRKMSDLFAANTGKGAAQYAAKLASDEQRRIWLLNRSGNGPDVPGGYSPGPRGEGGGGGRSSNSTSEGVGMG